MQECSQLNFKLPVIFFHKCSMWQFPLFCPDFRSSLCLNWLLCEIKVGILLLLKTRSCAIGQNCKWTNIAIIAFLNCSQTWGFFCIQKWRKATGTQKEREPHLCHLSSHTRYKSSRLRGGRGGESSGIFCCAAIFVFHFFMTTYLYLKESFQRAKKHH